MNETKELREQVSALILAIRIMQDDIIALKTTVDYQDRMLAELREHTNFKFKRKED